MSVTCTAARTTVSDDDHDASDNAVAGAVGHADKILADTAATGRVSQRGSIVSPERSAG